RGRVPKADVTGRVAGGQSLAVGRIGDGQDGAVMTRERLPQLAAGQIPQFDALGVAGHRHGLVVGRERRSADVADVLRQGRVIVPRCNFSYSQNVVATAAVQLPARERELHIEDVPIMTSDTSFFL